MNIEAVIAPDRAAAAQYYPPIYWFSLLKPPGADKFPGTGPNGNGIPREFKSRDQWLDVIELEKMNMALNLLDEAGPGTRIKEEEYAECGGWVTCGRGKP